MPKNLKFAVSPTAVKQFLLRYKKPIIITTAVTLLQLIYGFDAKFSIINIIWLFV